MALSRRSTVLCIEGARAEFEGRVDDPRGLYRQSWDEAVDDYDRTVAAHYIAHLETDSAEQFRWNQIALDHAGRADKVAVTPFMGSLYVNMGRSFEIAGDTAQARHYYALAAEHGVVHQPDIAEVNKCE